MILLMASRRSHVFTLMHLRLITLPCYYNQRDREATELFISCSRAWQVVSWHFPVMSFAFIWDVLPAVRLLDDKSNTNWDLNWAFIWLSWFNPSSWLRLNTLFLNRREVRKHYAIRSSPVPFDLPVQRIQRYSAGIFFIMSHMGPLLLSSVVLTVTINKYMQLAISSLLVYDVCESATIMYNSHSNFFSSHTRQRGDNQPVNSLWKPWYWL